MVTGQLEWSKDNPAPLDLRVLARFQVEQARQRRNLEIQLAKEQEKLAADTMREKSGRVQSAMAHPYTWATEFTETYDEHWSSNGRSSPYGPFPRSPYMQPLFEVLMREPIVFCEKSRTMMLSWACVAYLLWEAMRTPMCGILFQCQKEDKVIQLLDYAKCLWERQPSFLKEAFPLARPLHRQPSVELEFSNGAYIHGIPGGADQIRSFHPWGYLLDEAAFVTEAGECYEEAISAVRGKIILNSSAGPGWYADAKRGVTLSEND